MSTFNQSVFQFIYNIGHRNGFLADSAVFFAQYLPYFLVLGFLVLVYYQKGWRNRIYLFCEAALSVIIARGIITETIRFFYHHPRPFDFYNFTPLIAESGWSFPSGHATWFFALAICTWYINRTWGVVYITLAIVMAIARIYVGVHWPLDVIAGAVIGIGSALFMRWTLRGPRQALGEA